MARGKAIYAASAPDSASRISVALARANSAATMPSVGVVAEDIANNATGLALASGEVIDVDTSAFAYGDILYVSAASAGVLAAYTRNTTKESTMNTEATNQTAPLRLTQPYGEAPLVLLLENVTSRPVAAYLIEYEITTKAGKRMRRRMGEIDPIVIFPAQGVTGQQIIYPGHRRLYRPGWPNNYFPLRGSGPGLPSLVEVQQAVGFDANAFDEYRDTATANATLTAWADDSGNFYGPRAEYFQTLIAEQRQMIRQEMLMIQQEEENDN